MQINKEYIENLFPSEEYSISERFIPSLGDESIDVDSIFLGKIYDLDLIKFEYKGIKSYFSKEEFQVDLVEELQQVSTARTQSVSSTRWGFQHSKPEYVVGGKILIDVNGKVEEYTIVQLSSNGWTYVNKISGSLMQNQTNYPVMEMVEIQASYIAPPKDTGFVLFDKLVEAKGTSFIGYEIVPR